MRNSYIPSQNSGFVAWLVNFAALLTATPGDYGLEAGDAAPVQAQADGVAAAYSLANDPTTRSSATVAAFGTVRAVAEAIVRPVATGISRDPSVGPDLKVGLGVTVPDSSRSRIAAPTTAPALMLNNAVPGVLNLAYRDSTAPLVRSKPDGVTALELVASYGTVAATDPSQCEHAGDVVRTPFQLDVSANPGKVVTLFARWKNRSGVGGMSATGPWSAPLVSRAI